MKKIFLILVFILIISLLAIALTLNKPSNTYMLVKWDEQGNIIDKKPIKNFNLKECNNFDLVKETNSYISRVLLMCSSSVNVPENGVVQTKFLPFDNEVLRNFNQFTISDYNDLNLKLFLFDAANLNEEEVIDDFQLPLKWTVTDSNTYTDEIVINGKLLTIVWGMEHNGNKNLLRKDLVKERNNVIELIEQFEI